MSKTENSIKNPSQGGAEKSGVAQPKVSVKIADQGVDFQESRLAKVQTRDLPRLSGLRHRIRTRQHRGQPVDRLIVQYESLLKQSIAKTQTISQKFPVINLPDDLPITAKAEEITKFLNSHQVVIVAGETGCGKTTQLPKICMQAGYGSKGLIAHTQPRRVAATSVASRIASELKVNLGELVGYSIRFADKTSADTRVKLMTDGVLLAEIESDPLLSHYEVIIIDEAHERSLNIDFLLGFLKQIVQKRSDLKIIITSATINPKSFSDYFGRAPMLQVEGRTFPVDVRYRPLVELEANSNEDVLFRGIYDAVDECLQEASGDILIFSHGENEIKQISEYLRKRHLSDCNIHPLFARLGLKEQQAIFSSSAKRKIIIATNVAETSLTIPNIVFVIDIGTARISRYSQRTKIQQLPVEKISQASAEQRKGRCGRICPGICIRLYSKDDFDGRKEYTLPEIKRTNLASVALRLKNMRVSDVEHFPFIDAPDDKQWKNAFTLLYELGATDQSQNISRLGKRMASLPVDPQLARILVNTESKAINEMLIISSFLSVRDPRMRPQDKSQKADQKHQAFVDEQSDVLSVIKLWKGLNRQREKASNSQFRKWCNENFINFVGWLEWRNVFFQLKEAVDAHKIPLNQQPAPADEIHRSIIYGFVSHILLKTPDRYYQGARGLKIWIHPSSVLARAKKQWLLATELIETGKLFARNIMPIEPSWLETIAPHLLKNNYLDVHWRKSKGQAAAFLTQTIFGLPIVYRKLVNYTTVDLEASRALFLTEGLASDNLQSDFPFLKANRKTLEVLEEQENKLRTSEIRIDSQALADLYAAKIPSQIATAVSLKRWLKKNWTARNTLLSFGRESLSHVAVDENADYPASLLIRGVELPLSYRFAPGEPDDGVTVNIPQEMLDQFSQFDFDWLVPGLLEQKILSVLKKLPKSLRKNIIPLANTAEKLYQSIIKTDYTDKPFKNTLALHLNRLTSLNVNEHDFVLEDLPEHLQIKFRVANNYGSDNAQRNSKSVKANFGKGAIRSSRPLGFAKTLGELLKQCEKERLGKKQSGNSNVILAGGKLSASVNSRLNEKLYSWPAQSIQLEKISNLKGQSVRLLVGLVDKQTHVELSKFSSLACAHNAHIHGCARLLTLANLKIIKDIQNSWPNRNRLEYLNLRNGGFKSLVEWFSFRTALQLISNFEKEKSKGMDNKQQVARRYTIETEFEFKELCSRYKAQLRLKLSEYLNNVVAILEMLEDIYRRMSEMESSTYAESIDDIRHQLKSLWSRCSILSIDSEIFSHFQRYFTAIKSRLQRIDENFPKEQLAMEQWVEWQEWWESVNQQLQSKPNQMGELKPTIDNLFWQLEEFRISLFATNVKTNGKISAKRLQKAFEELETSIARLV